jgi:hypothetical protein
MVSWEELFPKYKSSATIDQLPGLCCCKDMVDEPDSLVFGNVGVAREMQGSTTPHYYP